MPADLTLTVLQSYDYEPGDKFDLFLNSGGQSGAVTSAVVLSDADLWPGQSLGLMADEGTEDSGSMDGIADAAAGAEDATEDGGTEDEPAGAIRYTIADARPGMWRARVRTEDVFYNTATADFAYWLHVSPHDPWRFAFASQVSSSFRFTFKGSRSFA